MQQFHDTPMWSRPQAELSWEWYLGDAHGRDDVSPYAAPARADRRGRPPARVHLDHGVRPAARRRASSTRSSCWPQACRWSCTRSRGRSTARASPPAPRSPGARASSASPCYGVPSVSTAPTRGRRRYGNPACGTSTRGCGWCPTRCRRLVVAGAVGADHEQRAAVVTAQRTGERLLAGVDPIGDLAALAHPDDRARRASANQIAPSASSVQPSGSTSPRSAQSRRSCRVPSSAMVNAVARWPRSRRRPGCGRRG